MRGKKEEGREGREWEVKGQPHFCKQIDASGAMHVYVFVKKTHVYQPYPCH